MPEDNIYNNQTGTTLHIDSLRELREAADRLIDIPGDARMLLSKFLVIDEAMLTSLEIELGASRNALHVLSPSQAQRMRNVVHTLGEVRTLKGGLARRLAQPPQPRAAAQRSAGDFGY